jgi:hypothetical protein
MLKSYWLVAIRKMLRYRFHSLVNILGLTIGITSCLIIFLLTRFELSYDGFHPNKDRIYRVVGRNVTIDRLTPAQFGYLPTPLPVNLHRELTGVRHVAAFYNFPASVNIPQTGKKGAGAPPGNEFDQPEAGVASPIIITDSQYFGTFQYRWLAGNAVSSLTAPGSVVLSENEMTRYFGNITPDQAIGRTVIYADSLFTTVRGIVKDWSGNTDLNFKDFISLSTVPGTFLRGSIHSMEWAGWGMNAQAFVELVPGNTPQRVERQLPALLSRYWPHHPGDTATLVLQPLGDVHFNADYRDAYSRKVHLPTLIGLMAIAGFILLLAAINFINLSTAQSLLRTKEIGIRKVLGSSRKDIAIQFLGETFLVTGFAVLLSIVFVPAVIPLMHEYLPPGVRLDLSGLNLGFMALMTLVTALLAGWYPARMISRLLPVLSLKGQTAATVAPNRYLHRALIVFQFAISVGFVICTVIVARQLHYMLNADLGFSSDAVLTIRPLNAKLRSDREPALHSIALVNQLRALPEIAEVTRHMETPMGWGHGATSLVYKGPNGDRKVIASLEMADPQFLGVFGLRLAAGRNLYPSDTIRELLINETAARGLGFPHSQDAIGHIAVTGIDDLGGPIVGVIKDFHSSSLRDAITPFFVSSDRESQTTVSIRLAPAVRNPEMLHGVLGKIAGIWRGIYPNQRFKYAFLDNSIAALYSRERRLSGLLQLAMGIAIAISCMGLLALATLAAEQRSKEMSIRRVLGASIGSVFALLTRNFLWPVALAFVIAAPVAWYFMHHWLEGFVYRTTAPWWIFVICGVAAVAIALLTVGYQAMRTATANPAERLRAE